jgi:putative aldouronate transport system permease protein
MLATGKTAGAPLSLGRPRKTKKAWHLFYIALPLMILVVLFRYVPLFGWALSLFEYHLGTPIFENKFVGLKYFKMIFQNKDTARVMINTIVFALISFATLPLPMLLAIFLNELPGRRFRKLSQTLSTLPYFISWIIVYSIAFNLFGSEGMLNQIRVLMGLKPYRLGVLTDPDSVYWFQGFLTIWKTLGWNAIIYIAALTGIDQELYEAARVDGASRLQCALHITLPGLMPTFLVLMLLNVSNFVNIGFEQYFVFNNSFVFDKIEVIDLYNYRMGLQLFDYSYATAIGILKSFISIAMLVIANTVAKASRGEGIV